MRRVALARRHVAAAGLALVLTALSAGLLVGGSNQAQLAALQAENDGLRAQNESYLLAAGELTNQITDLQAAISELDGLADLDPATRRAIDRLPAIVRARAMGGDVAVAAARSVPLPSPEGTFGKLKDLLGSLADGLEAARTHFEKQQALARATPAVWPVAGWLSSSYGNRKDPFTGAPDFHPGLDISANRGTPVRAPADGTVETAGVNGNYGRSVLLGHGFGLSTRFGHLSAYVVRSGQRVRRGDLIGYVGSTGRATSSHLHYEVLLNGAPINPLRLLTRP